MSALSVGIWNVTVLYTAIGIAGIVVASLVLATAYTTWEAYRTKVKRLQ